MEQNNSPRDKSIKPLLVGFDVVWQRLRVLSIPIAIILLLLFGSYEYLQYKLGYSYLVETEIQGRPQNLTITGFEISKSMSQELDRYFRQFQVPSQVGVAALTKQLSICFNQAEQRSRVRPFYENWFGSTTNYLGLAADNFEQSQNCIELPNFSVKSDFDVSTNKITLSVLCSESWCAKATADLLNQAFIHEAHRVRLHLLNDYIASLRASLAASRQMTEYSFLTRFGEDIEEQMAKALLAKQLFQKDFRIYLQSSVHDRLKLDRSFLFAYYYFSTIFLISVIAFLRELFGKIQVFRTADELETSTGYPVLGQIPTIPARKRTNVLKYLTDRPTSAAAEAVRNLRTTTLLSNVDNPPQVIMLTSSLPGEGKTTLSLSLTQNLTGLGKKVLLIEGDIRRRVFAEYFDIKGKQGLLAVLSGERTLDESVVNIRQLGADILVGERSYASAADVFSSDAFREFLATARAAYDYIIIDTPPVLVVPDARIIGSSVDAILYTVKWDSTTKRRVSEGLKSFENVNLSVTGLVLGQINARGMIRYGYWDVYEAYGKYRHGYYDN